MMKTKKVKLKFSLLVAILFLLILSFVFIPFTVITRNTVNEVTDGTLKNMKYELNAMARMAYYITLLQNSIVLDNLALEDKNAVSQNRLDEILYSGDKTHLLEFIVVKELDKKDVSSFAWYSVLKPDLAGYLELTPLTSSGWHTLDYESGIVMYYVVPLFDDLTGKHYRSILGGFILNDNMKLYSQIADLTDGNVHNVAAVYKNKPIGYIKSMYKDEVSLIMDILAENMFLGKYKGVVFNSQVFPEQSNEDLILYAFSQNTSFLYLEDFLYRSFLFLLVVLGFALFGIGYFIIKIISIPLGNLALYAENLTTDTHIIGFDPGIVKEIDEIGRYLKKNVDTIYIEKTRLENTIEATRTGTWEWNVQTGETVFNERFADIIGYTLEELSPVSIESWKQHAHPDDLEQSNTLLEKHFSGESEYYECESRMKHKNGEWVWVLDRGKVISRSEDGKPLIVMGTHTDITERKRAEAAFLEASRDLIKAQAVLRSALEQSPSGIMIADAPNVNMRLVNEKAAQILGMSETAQLDISVERLDIIDFLMFYPDGDQWPMEEAPIIQIIQKEREFYDQEMIIERSNGERCFITLNGRPVRDLDGRVIAGVIVFSDITRRKETEEALRESESRFREFFSKNPMSVQLVDNNGFTLQVNESHTRLFGAVPPSDYCVFSDPLLERQNLSGLWNTARNGHVVHFPDFLYNTRDLSPQLPDKPVWLQMTVFPLYRNSARQQQYVLMHNDITERKRAESLIAAKNKELEQLVYVASHDLRSPLVNVDGYSREIDYSIKDLTALLDSGADIEVLVKALRTEFPEMEKSITRIRTSAAQMDKLLKGLLHLSRLGRAALLIDDIDMNERLAQIADSFAFVMKEKGVELRVDTLPGCRGDAVQLTQVFCNLIDNAIKYRDPDRPLRVRVSGSMEVGCAVYRITDNGVGIADNHLRHVFELFHRLDPDKTEGDGLGLAVAHQSITRMNGEIKVESELGKGSVFIVSLPPASNRANGK